MNKIYKMAAGIIVLVLSIICSGNLMCGSGLVPA